MSYKEELCQAIETAMHQKMRSPKDFECLRERIFTRVNVMVSTTTLKRFWGYLRTDSEASHNTLDTLARFIGYPDFDTFCKRSAGELWEATGNVLVSNVIKKETMETDTLYWDNVSHEIWTDCYVKMHSPSGLMQGYGMRSDEMARNAILMHPFDTEFLIEDEENQPVQVDSVNFIGPMLKK